MRLLELGYELPKNWREATISDVTSKVGSGATPRGGSSVYTNNGIPLVRSQNVLDNSFSNAGLAFLSDQSASSLKNVELRANDVLLNITGDSILRCCLLPDAMIGGRVNQHVAIIRASDAVIPLYLQKWLVQDWFKDFMLSHSAGATRKAITKGQILSFPIALPPLPEQRRIAEVLGALDDKIESNRRIAVKCDEVASELFGHAASMNQKLDEVSEVRMGVSPPGSSYNETGDGMAFFQGVRDFSLLHPVARVYTNQPKRLAAAGDILFSVRAPVGRLNIADSPCCIGRGLAAITSNRSATCLFALRAAAAEWEKFSAEGTVFGAVNQKSLKSTLIPWPDPVTEEELEYQLSSLVALASQRERESISLSKLRDALLPQLMSGRMRVDEAGRLVSEALNEEAR